MQETGIVIVSQKGGTQKERFHDFLLSTKRSGKIYCEGVATVNQTVVTGYELPGNKYGIGRIEVIYLENMSVLDVWIQIAEKSYILKVWEKGRGSEYISG